MIITIGKKKLIRLLTHQLKNLFLCDIQELKVLREAVNDALVKTEFCLTANTYKFNWNSEKKLQFNPYHSNQYVIFLYILSHLLWKKYGNSLVADKVYYLNKVLNSCDLFYQIELPNIFFFQHPLSTVIGRASFSNYLVTLQNCTIGSSTGWNDQGIYPTFGEFVYLFANSSVIGSSKIGNNVFISANTSVINEDIPDNTVVFGQSPNLILKQKPERYFYERSYFKEHKQLLN
jgi:serine O-acetyltransferase